MGDFMMNVPIDYQQVASAPGDPQGSISFMKKTDSAVCLAQYYAIQADLAMPFSSTKEVIDGIHKALGPNQGLIEVLSGVTPAGKKYIFTIVKTGNRPNAPGTQYCLTLQIGFFASRVFYVQGFFDETGFTGGRDTSVYAILQNEGKIGPNGEGWMADPYDPEYQQGLLMNLSEKTDYDEIYPTHPLTEARSLAARLIQEN